jgi:hypothetical protein
MVYFACFVTSTDRGGDAMPRVDPMAHYSGEVSSFPRSLLSRPAAGKCILALSLTLITLGLTCTASLWFGLSRYNNLC